MLRKYETTFNKILPAAIIMIIIVLLFNSIMLARTVGYIHFPGEMGKTEVARQAAEMKVDFYEQRAAEANVLGSSSVRDALAQMKFELEKAKTLEGIFEVQSIHGENLREVIDRELDKKRSEIILNIINKDQGVKYYEGESLITISKKETSGVEIEDGANLLSEKTVNLLKQNKVLRKGTWSPIEVRVDNGKSELVTARTLIDRIKMYETEVNGLRSELKEIRTFAGLTELTGGGITVKLFDSEEGFSDIDIVHDRDVRDVVNELLAAGAAGVSIGDNRIVANSSVRCAGPVILVNQQPIAVNPIVIKAVGDPKILASSLDLIKSQLMEFGIRVDISEEENISLPPLKEKSDK
ncbi:MAG: DUF881 domain-containing protein [Clostridia bacterium]|nr:DUF881 domain-containing protein [Clostridia bacterium]